MAKRVHAANAPCGGRSWAARFVLTVLAILISGAAVANAVASPAALKRFSNLVQSATLRAVPKTDPDVADLFEMGAFDSASPAGRRAQVKEEFKPHVYGRVFKVERPPAPAPPPGWNGTHVVKSGRELQGACASQPPPANGYWSGQYPGWYAPTQWTAYCNAGYYSVSGSFICSYGCVFADAAARYPEAAGPVP